MFLQLVANGLVTGSVIALAAVGVSIVYGILRLVNFAYGAPMLATAALSTSCAQVLGRIAAIATSPRTRRRAPYFERSGSAPGGRSRSA